jgi:hypothetical protein
MMELGKAHTYTDVRSQKIQEPQNKTNMMKIYIKDSLTLLENTYIQIQKMRWVQQIPNFTCLLAKETKKTKKENTYSPHAAYFHLFCSKDKATKAGCPTTRCG